MSYWETLPLGDVLTFQRGFDITKAEQRDGPYWVISSSGPKSRNENYKVVGPGVVIGRKGSLGTVFYSHENYWPHDTTLWVKDFHGNDPKFAYYYLQTMSLERLDAGSSNPSLNRNHIHTIPVLWPTLVIQRRIAGILSTYDDLIENSQRRIKILEEMARRLYREWFVHFRFPGHEGCRFVESPLGEIPEGWEVKTVEDSFVISGGGTPSRKEEVFWEGGTIQWYSPSDLTGAGTMFMDDSRDHITELGLVQSSARMFPARSVMLTSRATIGAIAINTHPACTNQGFITCLPNDRVPLYFLFHWLVENVPTFQRMASGSTFREISRGVFKTIEFLHPPVALVSHFEAAAEPIAEEMLSLQRQIQNLRRTRDLLLPRLLSGQIDVEALPEPALQEVS
jgi:type I restriction enzyme S subunit